MASKEDVLWSIVQRAAEKFHREIRPVAHGDAPPGKRLREMCRAHVRVLAADVEHASVFLHEWRFLSVARRDEIALKRDAYEAYFRDAIRDGIARGDFRKTDVSLAAAGILSALNGLALWYQPNGRLSADEIGEQYADLFEHALSRTTDSRSGGNHRSRRNTR